MNTPPNIMNTMNIGVSAGGRGTTGANLLAGVRNELSQLVSWFDRLVNRSGELAQNMSKVGAQFAGIRGQKVGDFIDDSGGMNFRQFGQGMRTIGVGAITAASQAIDLDQFAENSMSRARIGFLSGRGPQVASAMAQRMMNMGTGLDPLSGQRAQLVGASLGLNPALSNYGTVLESAATVSNLMPGADLPGGMQASAALNQAQNVNRLRMIGIQVRDPNTGLFRGVGPVIEDIWSVMSRSRTGTAAITKKDVAFALQPGNSLDLMIKQYFGNDPVLAGAVRSGLLQKAGGGDLSKESLIESGALPALAVSQGERFAKEFGVTEAYTGNAERGMIGANAALGQVADSFRESVNVFGGAVEAFAGIKQFAGGAGGAVGTIGASLLSGGVDIAQSLGLAALLRGGGGGGGLGAVFGRGGNPAGQRNKIAGHNNRPTGAGSGPRGLGRVAIPGLSALFGGALGFEQGSSGQDLNILDLLLSTGSAAALGFLFGGPTGALAAGGVTFGSQVLGHMIGSSVSGEGDGEDGPGIDYPLYNPVKDTSISAAWRKRRDYKIAGKDPANKFHTGVDFAVGVGNPVYSVKKGTVVAVKDNGSEGFGKSIAIRHGDGYTSFYAHLNAQGVKVGDQVEAGQPIGISGNTGLSSGPHLHFEVREKSFDQSTNVDPIAYISGATKPTRAADFTAESATSGETAEQTKSLIGTLSSGQRLLPSLIGAPSPRGEGDGGGVSTNTNYGGVTVNINVPKGANINEQTLAREIKRVLSEEELMNRAVTR